MAKQANGIGHNSGRTLTQQGKSYVERIETCLKAIVFEQEKARELIKPLREDVNEILTEAESNGLTKKSIRAVVKARALAMKADAAREALDIADRDTFDRIRLALGDYADTELGGAALAAAPDAATHGA